jgi:hypothetical protein
MPSLSSNTSCISFTGLFQLFLNSRRSLISITFAISLAACGGGSGDSSGGDVVIVDEDTTAPGITSSTTLTLDEGTSAGLVIYTVTSDDDTANYTLSGDDSSAFTIEPATGAVTLIVTPDFETQSSYTFTATATDTSGNSSSITVVLSINDISLASFTLEDIEVASDDIKKVALTWSSAAVSDSQSVVYTICEKDTSQANNCNRLGSVTDELTATVTLPSLVNAMSTDYFVLASSSGEFELSSEATISTDDINKMIGYFKTSNTGEGDYFGENGVALSGDGHILAVGAYGESNSASGVITDGSEVSDVGTINESGAVYIFSNNSGKWIQTAYVKASNPSSYSGFGFDLALSDDGTTLVVGAYGESNGAAGVFMNSSDITDSSTLTESGAVYVFNYNDGAWIQSAYIKASIPGESEYFGGRVALSGDGSTLVVTASDENNGLTGVITDGSETRQEIGTASSSGAVYSYSKNTDGTWVQTAYIKAPETTMAGFGYSAALSFNGDTLAVGNAEEQVYIFNASSDIWSQTTYLEASNKSSNDSFGSNLSLSHDGNTLAVSASKEDNSATGIFTDNSESAGDISKENDSGAVYLFTNSSVGWTQSAYIKASNTESSDYFGHSIALSGDGNILAVGAYREDNSATGIIIDGSESTATGGDIDTATDSGAVYLFTNNDGVWIQSAYIKASNTGAGDDFGYGLALTNDGTTLAVGARLEDSSQTGIITDGTENKQTEEGGDDTAYGSGAVYVY